MRLMGTLLCPPHTHVEHWRASSTLKKVKTRLHQLLNLKTRNFLPPIRMNKVKLCSDVWHSKEFLEADEKVTASSRKDQARSLKASTTAELQQAALSNQNHILSELSGGLVMKCSSQQSLKFCHPLIWLNGKKACCLFSGVVKVETESKEVYHGLTYTTSKSHFLHSKSLKYTLFHLVERYDDVSWQNIKINLK